MPLMRNNNLEIRIAGSFCRPQKWEATLKFQLSNYRIYSINRPGRLLNFWTLRVGAYSRWALIRGWALIRINTVTEVLRSSQLQQICIGDRKKKKMTNTYLRILNPYL